MKARMIALVCLGSILLGAGLAMADVLGTGDNQFTIDFVTISGDANPTSGIPAGAYFTFTGVQNDYRIGTQEITNDQWTKFEASLGVPIDGTPADAYDYPPGWGDQNDPVNGTSWYQAAQFVNWLNTSTGHHAAYKFTGAQGTAAYALSTWSPAEADNGTNLYRHKDAFYYLPTENEWVKAAYWNGTTMQTYANASPGDLVSGKPDPTKWNYPPSATTDPWNVGSGAEELNGTYDMMGNVQEWLEDPYPSDDYSPAAVRVTRGGSYHKLLIEANWVGSTDPMGVGPIPELNNGTLGFRVASEIPEPAMLSLVALGGMALIRRRRK